jgi:hypothetical protein
MSQGESEFEKAGKASDGGIVGEFWSFLRANQNWWLLPILLVLLVFGLLLLFSTSAAAPFIYTLF